MRSEPNLAPTVTGLLAALAVVAAVTMVPGQSAANDRGLPGAGAGCSCPQTGQTQLEPRQPGPKPAEVRPALDERDWIAALEAVQLALSEVGDGAAYVWHARNGRLSGVVQPTQSFKDSSGKICRHIIMELSAGGYSRQTEGVACRLETGVWQLEG